MLNMWQNRAVYYGNGKRIYTHLPFCRYPIHGTAICRYLPLFAVIQKLYAKYSSKFLRKFESTP